MLIGDRYYWMGLVGLIRISEMVGIPELTGRFLGLDERFPG